MSSAKEIISALEHFDEPRNARVLLRSLLAAAEELRVGLHTVICPYRRS
jgi:hypothetical protein